MYIEYFYCIKIVPSPGNPALDVWKPDINSSKSNLLSGNTVSLEFKLAEVS